MSRLDLASSGGSTPCAIYAISLCIQASVSTRVASVNVSCVQIHWLGFRNKSFY